MAELAQSIRDQLPRIKKNVKGSYDGFRHNFERYWEYNNMIFRSAMSDAHKSLLKMLGKPPIEFNIMEAPLSRLRGEFAKQEPSIIVSGEDDADPTPEIVQMEKVVEGHMRHIMSDFNKQGGEYNVYTDQLSGGFSVIKVWTEYSKALGFNQVIKMDRVFDPTLCGFDLLARQPSKSDGRFCFENYPKAVSDFKDEYPGVDISDLRFEKMTEEFNWSYSNDKEDIVMVCDYYEKKKKKVKIVQLPDGSVLTDKEYKHFLELWGQSGRVDQPPVVMQSRKTEIDIICRYTLIGSKILSYEETDYPGLPLVFVDGNSRMLRKSLDSLVEQFTRPYVYNAKGNQLLKNFAGQSLAAELENMVQHNWIMAEEAMPTNPDYMKAYTNNQIPRVVAWKSQDPKNPDKQLPAPQPVVRPPIPPEIAGAFMAADQTQQNILGAYDAALGINGNDISGKALIEGATNSNAAAMPYVVSFLHALNQCAELILGLMPKYLINPRKIPVIDKEGNKDTVKINDGKFDMRKMENKLRVKVEAGVNFAVQKSKALQQIVALMNVSPVFAQFMGTDGLPIMLDNIEIRGIDQLKLQSKEFVQKMQMQQAQAAKAQQQEAQNNPAMMRAQIEMMKLQHDKQQDDIKNQIAVSQQAIDQVKEVTNRMKVELEAKASERESLVRMAAQETEKMGKEIDLSIAVAHEHHAQISDHRQHDREDARLIHDVHQANKPKPEAKNA